MSQGKQMSVIIIAHKRTEFISRALESALMQSLDRSLYEIIIIKNFIDPGFDRLAIQKGVQVITSDRESLGGKVSQGISVAEGSIIVFLEDDDEFLPEKLEKTLIEFENSPRLIYFHNAALPVNDRNEIGKKAIMGPPATLSINGQVWHEQFNILINTGSYGNNSCVAVRKTFLELYIGALERLNVTTDGFIFLAALSEGGIAKFEKTPYTRYHVDSGFTYRKHTNISDYTSSKLSKSEIMLEDKTVFDRLANSCFKDSILRRFSGYSLMKEKLNYNLFSEKRTDLDVGDLFRYILDSIYFGRLKALPGILIHLIALRRQKVASKLEYYIQNIMN